MRQGSSLPTPSMLVTICCAPTPCLRRVHPLTYCTSVNPPAGRGADYLLTLGADLTIHDGSLHDRMASSPRLHLLETGVADELRDGVGAHGLCRCMRAAYFKQARRAHSALYDRDALAGSRPLDHTDTGLVSSPRLAIPALPSLPRASSPSPSQIRCTRR